MKENKWNEMGLEHYNNKDYEKSLECYNKTLKINKSNILALKNKTQILTELGRFKEALENVNKEIEIKATCENLNNKGNILNLLNRLPDAIRYYNKALKICPKNKEALYNKAITLINLGEFKKALISLDLLEDNFSKIHLKADILMQMEKFEEAIAFYDKLLIEDKLDLDVLNNKAIALINLGKLEKALKCYNIAIENDSDKEELWINKGQILIMKHEIEEAIQCFDKALELNSENKIIWLYKAQAYLELNNEEKASECFDKL